jgi:hypothetical protein
MAGFILDSRPMGSMTMALPAVRAEVGQAAKIWENQAEDGEISWGMGKLVIVLIYIYILCNKNNNNNNNNFNNNNNNDNNETMRILMIIVKLFTISIELPTA